MIENYRFWTLGTFKQLSWKNQLSRIFFHFKPIFELMLLGYVFCRLWTDEANRSNKHGTRTPVGPWPFGLEWCVIYCALIGYILPHNGANGSHRADTAKTPHSKNLERPVWPWSLTFRAGNIARHIIPSWLVFVPHMKQIGPTYAEPQRRHSNNSHGQNFERSMWSWLLTFWPGNVAWHIVTACVVIMPIVIRIYLI